MIKKIIGLMAALVITAAGFCAQAKSADPKPIGIFATITADYEEKDNDTLLLRQKWSTIWRVEEYGGENAEVFHALDMWNTDEKKRVYERRRKMLAAAKGHFAESPEYFNGYYDSMSVWINRADSLAVSLLTLPSDYTGGAHGMYGKYGVNFDTATGKKIELSDVFKDAEQTAKVVTERIFANYGEEFLFERTDEKILKDIVQNTASWTLDNDGVTFYFNPYALAPYAAGILTAKVYFDFDKEIFKDKYRITPTAYVSNISETLPLNINGEMSFVDVAVVGDKCRISVGAEEILAGDNVSDARGVFIHKSDGKNFVWADVKNNETGAREILVFAVEPNLHYVGTLKRTFFDPFGSDREQRRLWMTNPNGFMLYKNATLDGEGRTDIGSVGEDGMLVFG